MCIQFSPGENFGPDSHFMKQALKAECGKRDTGEMYHPVLFFPVHFSNSSNRTDEVTPLEDGLKPSFCNAAKDSSGSNQPAIEDLPPHPATSLPPDISEPASTSKAAQANDESSTTLAALPQHDSTAPKSEVITLPTADKIKAYDVVEALYGQVSLRLADEALYVFNGKAYKFVSQEVINRIIMAKCRQYVHAVGNASIIKQVYELIRSEPRIVQDSKFISPNLLSLDNGLLDLETGLLHPHSPAFFVTARVLGNFVHELSGQCPRFNQFLTEISGGDPLLIQRIWEMLGYSLAPDGDGKCFFLLQGVPDSGKSLLGRLLSDLFEEDTVTSLDMTAFGLQFGPSELVGKQLCLSLDLSASPWDSKAIAVLKQATGNDLMTADIKYQPRIKFKNTATIIFASNHAVSTNSPDTALFRRLVVIPFRHTIPRERQNRKLLDQLLTERDAIITTALMAYQGLKRNAYRFAGKYRINEVVSDDPASDVHSIGQAVADFIALDCILDKEALSFTSDLHQAFMLRYPAFSDVNAFSAALLQHLNAAYPGSVTKARKRKPEAQNATSAFKGLRLNSDAPLPEKALQ